MVLVLLGLMLNTGLQMALNSYRTVVAQSEAELLLSTAVDTLADDLRFAREVIGTDGGDFTYTSDSFGEGTQLTVGEKGSPYEGQILANGARFLSTGAYGVKGADGTRAYKIETMTITPKKANNTFEIYLKVVAAVDKSISAETKVTVRCLNKMTGLTSETGGEP